MRQVVRAGSPGVLRALAVAVAAAAAPALVLAGCGSATPSSVGPGGRTARAGPPGGTRAQALAAASAMMSRLVLPPGSRRLGVMPHLLRDMGVGLGSATLAGVHRQFSLPLPKTAAARFLLGHVPPGMRPLDNGQTRSDGGTMARDVGYAPRSLPAGVYRAELDLAVVAAPGSGSLLRADAQVIWYLPRTVAEDASPARFGSAVLTGVVLSPRRHTVTRRITSRAVIAELAGLLNGMHAAPQLVMSCPGQFTSYRAAFAATGHSRPGLVVTTGGCLTLGVRAAGRQQPALLDPGGRFAAAVARLLRIRAGPR